MESHGYLKHGLCPACLCIDIDSYDCSFGFRPVADIMAGCKIGCTFCGLLTYSLNLKPLMVESKGVSRGSVELKRAFSHSGANYPSCINAYLHTFGRWVSSRLSATLDITIIRNRDEISKGAIHFLAPRQQPLEALESEKSESILERSFDWVRKQLDECSTSHMCVDTLEMPLPTRIIEVGDHESPNVRLVVPDKGAAGKYAALSYCWGRSNHFVLTADTLKHLQNGFDLSQLPQTLQDAVRVTKEVGLRYLWVDALCIIQGQNNEAINDWNVEVSKMRDVYRNAFVTISAAAAQNSSGGLFNGIYCDFPFAGSWASSEPREVALWTRITWRNDTPDLDSEPINSRAWTLQENIFSRRILFYTSFGLLWKCQKELIWAYSGETRECDGTGQAEKEPMGHDYCRFFMGTSRYIPPTAQDGNLEPWMEMLELYTARNLTNPYDKLPALGAIAQMYSDSSGAQYLAGLWKPTFKQGLLWRQHPSYMDERIGRPDAGNPVQSNGYRAPSWSWAAIDGVVVSQWIGKNLESSLATGYTWLAEVITYPTPVLVNPRNPLGGVLKMRNELQLRGTFEIFNVPQYPPENQIVGIRPINGDSLTGSLCLDDYSETAPWRGRETEPLFCLHVLGYTGKEGPISQRSRYSYALALLQVHGLDHTYIRIGMADFYSESSSPSNDAQNMATETVTIL